MKKTRSTSQLQQQSSGATHQQQQPQLTQSSSAQNLANVKSGAAAFFGAMSQDWFR